MLQECTIGRRGDRVVISIDKRGAGLTWVAAVDFYMAVKRRFEQAREYTATGRDPVDLQVEYVGNALLAIRRVGLLLVVELGSRVWLEAPYDKAYTIAKAAYTKAKEIEADLVAVAERQIADQALLLRLGVPLQLTDDRRKLHEAVKTAVAAGGIHARGVVGRPSIIQT